MHLAVTLKSGKEKKMKWILQTNFTYFMTLLPDHQFNGTHPRWSRISGSHLGLEGRF